MAPKENKKKGAKNFKVDGVVPKYKFFGKDKLASYPDEGGVPLHVPADKDEKDFFKSQVLRDMRTSENEEMFHRLGMELCLSASSFAVGSEAILARLDPAEDFKALSKTGLNDLRDCLNTPAGQEFMEAVKNLNIGKSKRISKDVAEAAVSTYVNFVRDTGPGMLKDLGKAAAFSAKVYLFSMTLAKVVALLEDLESLAEKVQQKNTSIKSWKQSPGSLRKFKKALLDDFLIKMSKNGKSKKKKADDSSEDDDDDDDVKPAKKDKKRSSSSSDQKKKKDKKRKSSSSSSGHKKKKGKKSSDSNSDDKKDAKKSAKKDKKKAKKSSSSKSSSSDKDKKDAKKDIEKAKDKKKKRSSSSASDDTKKQAKKARKEAEAAKEKAKMAAQEEEDERMLEKVKIFSSWQQGLVQQLSAKLHTLLQDVGDSKEGTYPKSAISALLEEVPEGVAQMAKVPDMGDEEKIPNLVAKRAIRAILKLAAEADEFWETKGESSGASSKPADSK